MNSILCLFFLPCAQILGNYDTCTYGSALTECDQQVNHRCTGADCRKCILSYKITNDDRICCVIQLLQQIS